MNEQTKSKLLYLGLTAAGICCPVVSKASCFSWIAGIAALVWLYSFLELLCRYRTRRDTLLTGVSFTVSYVILFWGVLGDLWFGPVLFAVCGVIIYAAFCFAARIMVRWNRFPVTLVLPAVWLCAYLIATAIRFPSLARFDMMFADMTALIQSEHLIGSAGLSFALIWIVSILRFAAANRKLWSAGVGAGLVILLLIPGVVTLYPVTQAAESVRVAYTTGPYEGDFLHFFEISYEENMESMEHSVIGAAEQDAEILVFTEESFAVKDTEEEPFLFRCSELAAENDIAVLISLSVDDTDNSEGGQSENKVVLIDNEGNILDAYQKRHVIPIIEAGYEAGDGTIPSYSLELGGKTVKISYLICYDSNFPGYVRKIDPDTDILFLPSWDWSAVTQLHAKLCSILAAENRVYILKPTYDGLSVAAAPDGQIFYTSSTDETGYEQIQVVEMPLKSTCEVIGPVTELSPMICAVVGTEIMSTVICLLLILAVKVKSPGKSKRSQWFIALAAVDITGSCADTVSWMMGGAARLNTFLFFCTVVSLLMTLVMVGVFGSYIVEYIREKHRVSRLPVIISWIFVGVAVILTTVFSLTGDLFTLEGGVYTEGHLYSAYVIVNALAMLIGLIVIFTYRKYLTRVDRVIAYVYMLIPVVMAVINLWIADWSFAYPSITISMVLAYVMLQSDKMERLEEEGQIVSFHAAHDDLTGLFNRRAFNHEADLLKGTDGNSGIIFADINGLKYTNDRFGHEAGDQLLIRFADMLSGIFRAGDLFRISGDEFICLLQNVPESNFEERIRELKTALQQDKPPLACFGTAYGNNHDIEQLMNEAEARMYEEKEIIHAQYPEISR